MNGANVVRHQSVHTVQLPDAARLPSKPTDPETIAEAVTYLHRDGIVVLENAVDVEHIDALAALLGPEALESEYTEEQRLCLQRTLIWNTWPLNSCPTSQSPL